MITTDRQQLILKSIINEYIRTAKPVGSSNLVKKYDLPASPATIRYEMARLAHEGLIAKPHRSAGRIPTVAGLRYYLSNLFEEGVVDYRIETDIKNRLSKVRFDREKLIREAVSLIAEKTGNMGWSLMQDGVRVGGISYLLDFPRDTLKLLFALLEDEQTLKALLTKIRGENVRVMLADEIGLKGLEKCAMLSHKITIYGEHGTIGIVGPLSINYSHVIPILRFIASTTTSLVKDWKPRCRLSVSINK